MRGPIRVFLAVLLQVSSFLGVGGVLAETWVCSQPGKSEVYTDHGGPGCVEFAEVKTYSTVPSPSKSTHSPVVAGAPPVPPMASAQVGPPDLKRSSAISDRSLLLPIVAVSQPQPGMISGSWIGLVTSLTVSYAAHGRGPEVERDGNLRIA